MKKKYRKRLVGFVIVIAVFMSIIVFTAWKFNKGLPMWVWRLPGRSSEA